MAAPCRVLFSRCQRSRKIANQHAAQRLKSIVCPSSARLFSSESTKNKQHQYDLVIVGGGIVGMATAQELIIRHPDLKLAVVEKENELAAHQSGHNSGVVHAGIYYAPGSLKAKLCVKGLDMAYKYCDEHEIPYKKCGKLIVAVDPDEVSRLEGLLERGQKNGVKDLRMVGPDEIKDIEPNCVGLKAIHSPHTGIIDWGLVTKYYGKEFEKRGGTIYTNFEVTKFDIAAESSEEGGSSGLNHPVVIEGKSQENPSLSCRHVVTCGGLHSDKLAEKSGCDPVPRIVPFRGEYLLLSPEKEDLVRGNIYPVPDPRFPFLGVHFTPRMDGSVWLGPNAVLAFKREGYGYTQISLPDLADALSFRGLRKLAYKHLSYGLMEMYKGIYIRAQVKQLQRFVPSLRPEDVSRGPAGVRAQALDREGTLVDDFVFDAGTGDLGQRILHVRNAPSPAATSSLAIAEMVADRVEQQFSL
ncbi:L-2-hydroxyglutarate dehydrogenase, mitochondrial [Aplysia californica]|uniref:L-2-hydroxyglutarate dehydrogenase, mitochondrial n=1 Tax=Aplysia californica TaxID=6500 RepID=A0ABM0K6H5_APLCA|nr:L-2-hydroxyglutarate dehydrogenase, mitochondrial [Aplysia californica]